MSSTTHRLPRLVVPNDYDVTLNVSRRRRTFSGTLVLTARVREATPSLELNAVLLKVSEVRARVGKTSLRGKVRLHADRETIEVVFPRPLPKGKLWVDLAFSGKLNPNMHGLYLAQDGNDRAVVSQCEATGARWIFPCFDEPDLKATLKWTIVTDPGLTVVTNGVLEKIVTKRGKTPHAIHTFKRTRVIPTYLAAITIGELEATRAKRIAGTPCRVVCGAGKLGQTDFAAAVTAWVLPWYQDYFGQKYNYQKLDQVAVPGFDAGAMENVGAIFYRQNLLLMAPGSASWQAQKRIAEVIAHEISHQWFGNLVTMKWWDDLWLNEAFATWIAFKTIHQWKPKWRIWDEYLQSKEAALEADGLTNTHPVYTEVHSPAEATELFDVITYEKGCSVLRMVESYLGEKRFRDGIRRYQEAFKNGNATGADLWQKLAEASGEPVGELMQSWITEPGFPLVTVSGSLVEGRTILHVSQARFFTDTSQMQQPHTQVWPIPLSIGYDGGNGAVVHRELLREPEATVTLPCEASARWVYPNFGATGFYRVRLSDELLQQILNNGLSSLDAACRISLIDDQWALVRAGLSDVERFMDVVRAFHDERDYAVVRTLVGRLGTIDQRLVTVEARPLYADFVRWLLMPQLEEMGWASEPDEDEAKATRRAAVISALGDMGRDVEVLDEAEHQMHAEMHDPSAVDPNLAGVVLALAALRGDSDRVRAYLRVYRERKTARLSPELQARYLSALPYFENEDTVALVLNACLDGTIPQEQLRTVLVTLLLRRTSQISAWEFLREHWQHIAKRVGVMGIARLVEATGALPSTSRDDVLEFFTNNPVDEAKRALQKALEALALRKELCDREAPRLSDWLDVWSRGRSQS